jgi:hypothetical protein
VCKTSVLDYGVQGIWWWPCEQECCGLRCCWSGELRHRLAKVEVGRKDPPRARSQTTVLVFTAKSDGEIVSSMILHYYDLHLPLETEVRRLRLSAAKRLCLNCKQQMTFIPSLYNLPQAVLHHQMQRQRDAYQHLNYSPWQNYWPPAAHIDELEVALPPRDHSTSSCSSVRS